MPFMPWWKSFKSWLRTLRRGFQVRQVVEDLRRVLEERRLRQPARNWAKRILPQVEVLEERRLFANNVWLVG
jgi:hypothetical protein